MGNGEWGMKNEKFFIPHSPFGGIERMDRIGAVLLFAFGAFMAYQANRLPMRDVMTGAMGPGFLPLVLGVGIAALAAVSFLRPEVERIAMPHVGRILLLLLALIGYAVGLDRLGYVVTTFAMLAIMFVALAERGRAWLVALAAVVTVGSYYVFRILLQVPLPPDPLDLWR